MARDCYKIFKSTYAQAIADGLATAVATAAAQSAMNDCLGQQSRQVTANQPIVVVPGGRPPEKGPDTSPTDAIDKGRAENLGKKAK